jgi:hypothetical protein
VAQTFFVDEEIEKMYRLDGICTVFIAPPFSGGRKVRSSFIFFIFFLILSIVISGGGRQTHYAAS